MTESDDKRPDRDLIEKKSDKDKEELLRKLLMIFEISQ
jgi:hypothetical protein